MDSAGLCEIQRCCIWCCDTNGNARGVGHERVLPECKPRLEGTQQVIVARLQTGRRCRRYDEDQFRQEDETDWVGLARGERGGMNLAECSCRVREQVCAVQSGVRIREQETPPKQECGFVGSDLRSTCCHVCGNTVPLKRVNGKTGHDSPGGLSMSTEGWTNRRPRGVDPLDRAREINGKSMTSCKKHIGRDPSGRFREGCSGIEQQASLNQEY